PGEFRPAFGREGGSLLVAHVDEVDAVLDGAHQDAPDVAAVEGEEVTCAGGSEGERGQLPGARALRHLTSIMMAADAARPLRVVIAKVGLDGHDRGARIVARALRDAGMEVIYTGLHRRPEEVVHAALQEDADAIGVSILSGAHMTLFPRLIALMKEQGLWGEVALIGGGVMPDEDVEQLLQMGVAGIVGQDATPQEVVDAVRQAVRPRR